MTLMLEKFLFEVRQRFLLRWVIANIVGWTVGLYFGVLNPICFAGAGVVAGLVLGASQWWALSSTSLGNNHGENEAYTLSIPTHISQPARQWIISKRRWIVYRACHPVRLGSTHAWHKAPGPNL